MKIIHYIELIDLQARMKMRSQANKLILSYLWWILEPLLFVLLFYVVFKYILQRGGDDFFIFLIVGKIIYLWFSKGAILGSQSLLQNRGVIAQRSIPKWIFPLVNVQEATYKSIIAIILMLGIAFFTGYSNPTYWWQLIPLFLVQYFLIAGVSFFLSILVAIAEDFTNVISLFMMGMMFGSGVFWDINYIQDQALKEWIFLFNPLAVLIDSYRVVIIHNQILDMSILLPGFSFSLYLWVFSLFVFHRWNNQITRRLFS